MNEHRFTFREELLHALPSGALFWPTQSLLCVSDLHLGKAERLARRNGASLPPYETRDTLDRLAMDIEATEATQVLCLGDSFDDLHAAESLSDADKLHIARLQAGKSWIWIEGNHDPGPVEMGGTHLGELAIGPITFRHIAQIGAVGEVSGHYHPKAHVRTRARTVTRPAFLCDTDRIILPAYGTYTGGMPSHHPVFEALFPRPASAILTGRQAFSVVMPRSKTNPAASSSG